MQQVSSTQYGFYRTTALLLVVVLLLGLGFIAMQPGAAGPSEPSTADFTSMTDARIERGRYLALAGNCASCHTAPGGEFMAGGVSFETPFGTVFSTNITPDNATGIGAWSGQQFLDSMRHGVRPDGEHLYPVFPYSSFTRIGDEDMAALYVYFRSLPAVRQATPANDLSFPFNQRALLLPWKALYFEPGAQAVDPEKSTVWNRGAYLVEALAHCGACHTPRNALGAQDHDRAMAGGLYQDSVPGGLLQDWSAPNLTAATHGLGAWPEQEVSAYLKTGMNAFVDSYGPMNEVIQNSTRYLTSADVNAMAVYLKDLAPIASGRRVAADKLQLGMGRTQYNLHCGTCHLPTGLGDVESAPRLAGGSLVVMAENPASLINVILYGPERPDPPLPTQRRNPMDSFQYLLTDEEVAALATFVRHSWDNPGGVVTAEQVAAQR